MSWSARRTCNLIFRVPRLLKRSETQQSRFYNQKVAVNLSEDPERWNLMGAMYIERIPVITPPMKKIEREYKEYRQQLEMEQSLLSDYENAKTEEEHRLAEQRKNVLDTPLHLRNIPIITMQDKENIWNKDFTSFKPADRETEADKTGDVKTVDRKLDQTLVLVVKQNIGGKEFWYLPVMQHAQGMSMRQVAEKAVADTCGTDLKYMLFGNAPSGYQIKEYRKEVQEETKLKGSKIFIHKAEYRGGSVIPSEQVLDYAWLTPSELRKCLGRQTARIFNKFSIY
ncbi:large ribosomal subunit protein mL46-like [Saccostrea echinata]|uniref:large ribosomal subunit protein mL46-like n=1 Tax=Saccostrea echinata TaxID=191078 RepID=UPI002A841171|nr:large ribosomal subunit protein mL46-like [Saccostrea echinata]